MVFIVLSIIIFTIIGQKFCKERQKPFFFGGGGPSVVESKDLCRSNITGLFCEVESLSVFLWAVTVLTFSHISWRRTDLIFHWLLQLIYLEL